MAPTCITASPTRARRCGIAATISRTDSSSRRNSTPTPIPCRRQSSTATAPCFQTLERSPRWRASLVRYRLAMRPSAQTTVRATKARFEPLWPGERSSSSSGFSSSANSSRTGIASGGCRPNQPAPSERTTAAPLSTLTTPPAREAIASSRATTRKVSHLRTWRGRLSRSTCAPMITCLPGGYGAMLCRARTLSYSSVSDGSTPSPTTARAPTSLRRPGITPSPTNPSKGTNENGTAFGATYGLQKTSGHPQRSASALGSAGGYRRPLPTSRSMDGLGSASAQGAQPHFHYYQLDSTLESLGGGGNAAGMNGKQNGSRTTTLASPTMGAFSELGLTRSASASQMRDLQDQLKGLKGKISTLKEQARADSMRRRSLQSLRMPSPFTNATWEPGFAEQSGADGSSSDEKLSEVEYAYGNTSNSDNDHERKQAEYVASPIEEEEEEVEEEVMVQEEEPEEEQESGDGEGEEGGAGVHYEYPQTPEPQDDYEENYEESETPKGRALASPLEMSQHEVANGSRSSSPAESVSTEYTEAESSPEAVRDGYSSESEESLYHESFQQPISHEDREDAFDYEHFFLHSAMGTMGGGRLRSESVSSTASVETARGPTLSHKRSSSADSTASIDTFATAAEDPASRSSTAQSGSRVYTAADLFQDARERHARSFRDSSTDSNGTVSSQGVHQRSSTMTMARPVSHSSIKTMHRPSYSSFESVGTNRSFPLVNKAKLNGGILTPSGSPDQGLKRIRDSLLTDASSIYSQASSNSRGGQSPALQVLSKDVQLTVERLVASLGKCVLALGEADGAHPGGHELYKRRIEAALRVLEGEVELP
ncbi:hypothetical protein J3F84DRAFT_389127 [Trichoderma pleuroticola]